MLDLNFTPFPVLTTKRLILRKVTPMDENEIFFLRSSPQVMAYIGKPAAKTNEEAALFINNINELEQKNEAINWAITLKGESRLIGTICFWNIVKEEDRAEVGYTLHPHYHGKGIMHETMSEAIKFGFKHLGFGLVEAYTHKDNRSSIKLLERNLFKRDSILEKLKVGKEEPLTTVIYSIKKLNYQNL